MPPGDPSPRYRIADLAIDVGRRSVRRGGSEIHLSRLSFDVLRTLLDAAPNIVSNDELTRTVWKGVVVGPESVTQRVKLLRDALGDDVTAPRYIAGLRGHGYRIVPEVTRDSGASEPAPPPRDSYEPGQAPPDTRGSAPAKIPLPRSAIFLAAAALAVALTYLAVEGARRARPGPSQAAPVSSAASSPETPSPAASAPSPGQVFSPPPHSVAVLPFLNMSGDPRQEYFSDGITEELLNSLSRINELQVAARTSSFSFKGKDADIASVARKLNVRAVLEGSVRRSGRTIRVTAQLNDAVTGFHLWSQTYDRDLGDVLKVQTEIADAVAAALKVTLLGDPAATIEAGGTRNAAAFDAYLRASKTYWTIGSEKDLQTAVASYTEAIRLDPNYALAYAARSIAVLKATDYASTMPAVLAGSDKAEADARKTIALAPNLSEGHLALGGVYDTRLEFTHALEEYQRALALGPGNARVLRNYGSFAVSVGHGDSGLTALRRAVALDPLNRQAHMHLGYGLLALRNYAEAIAALKEAEAVDPPQPGALADTIGIAYYLLGEFESARSACENMRDEYLGPYCLAMTYDKLGRHADAETMLAKDRTLEGDPGAVHLSQVYAQWGETARALDWLEAAVRLRNPDLMYLKDPLFDPLRKEPRFQAIERELKFPP
jgi:TolB-like protein/DNA-binding winged helix-turn-helix (wHTH) protein/Tfp pilus assembly protein PilF